MSKEDQAIQEQDFGVGGDKAVKASGVIQKCKQQRTIGVGHNPRLVLQVYGFMLHWEKYYIDIFWRHIS